MARLTSKRRADVPGREIVSNVVDDLNLYRIVDIFYLCLVFVFISKRYFGMIFGLLVFY